MAELRDVFADPLDTLPRPRRGRPPAGTSNSELQRRRVLSALVELIAENGYAGCSVTDIARRAHVSRRTFYESFESKERALLAALEEAHTFLMREVLQAISGLDPWHWRLRAGLSTYLLYSVESPRISLLLREAWRAGPAVGLLHRRQLDEWIALLGSEVSAARRRDALLASVSVELDPRMGLGIVHALVVMALDAVDRGESARTMLPAAMRLVMGTVSRYPVGDRGCAGSSRITVASE